MQNENNFQNENNMPMKNNTVTIVLVVLLVLAIGAGAFFAGATLSNKSEKPDEIEKEKDKDEQKEKDKEQEKKANRIDTRKDCPVAAKDTVCIKKLSYNGNETEFKLHSIEVDENHSDIYSFQKLELNGKVIISTGYNIEISNVIPIKDAIFLEVKYVIGGGSSIGIKTPLMIDSNGKKLFTIENTEKFLPGIDVDLNREDGYYEVDGDSILVYGSRIGLFMDYGFAGMTDCYLTDINTGVGISMDPHVVNASNYDKFANTVVKETYKLEYLGNEKMSSLVKVDEKKLSEVYTKDHCEAQYKKAVEEMKEYEH